MIKPTIIFAGFSLKEYVEEARKLFPADSHRLVCVQGRDASSDAKETYLSLFDEVFDVNSIPVEAVMPVAALTCTQERDVSTYIKTLRQLGLIDAEQASLWHQAVNKREFKEMVRRSRPELVPQVSAFDGRRGQPGKLVYPFVIKPTNLTGSSFVSIIRNEAELTTYLKSLSEYEVVIKRMGREPELAIEEFIEGPQFSVNIYVSPEGKITYCPVIRVVPAFELGIDDTYSALQYNTDLPESELSALYQAIATIVDMFKIRGTSAHFDCIKSPTGWKVCEVGLRIGGNRQKLFQTSHGFSHFKNDLYNRAGKEIDLGERKTTVVIVQKAPFDDAELKKVNFQSPQEPGVTFLLDKLKTSNLRPGPVGKGGTTVFRAFVSGEDEATVIESATKLFESITF